MKFKYIVTLTNTRSFIQYEFFEKSIDETSHIEWYPVSELVRFEYVKMITRTRLKLNDHHWNIGNMRVEMEDGYDVDVKKSRILPYKNTMQNAITFEMSLSRKEFSRTVYNIMDFMRDMGGLFTTLGLIFGTLIATL